ncbi:type I 3-dehydroquinate dehydratase [Aureisphaera galaxeae]|uniref:type I 3-dehydroquinate dehydratase n=1 Tax=Aureisphaera galaxeae TaxID=1538023 RepID=UPI00234FF814|nr:bifunctional type I 3-dehydroquinate dehydratase/shikimate dehydrogenase [Aureisphaera galaxeae]MDC8005417.1 type I 3-dehydroquinate dehydratase [Aureisphaera galaxeae]
MKNRVDIVTTCTDLSQLALLKEQAAHIDIVEVRADLIEDPKQLRQVTSRPLVYVLRSKDYGGCFEGSLEERHELLKQAVADFDFIELEAEHDLDWKLLRAIPKHKRRIAWYGTQSYYEMLLAHFEKMVQTPAHLYKLILRADNCTAVTPLLRLLNNYRNKDLVAYGVGPSTEWSQVLSPFLGAPEVHTSLENTVQGEAHFSPSKVTEDYGLPYTYEVNQLFGIVGTPVLGSISPKLHNAAYRSMELPYLYLPFDVSDFVAFKRELMDNPNRLPIPLNGLTVVAPFKELAYTHSKYKEITQNKYAMACNGMVRSSRDWIGFSTDAFGATEALQSLSPAWHNQKIAIVGCGGAGRSIAVALQRKTSQITLVNRTEDKGKEIAASLELPFVALAEFDPSGFDIVIHATPLGKKYMETPFDVTLLSSHATVIDHVYALEKDTKLIEHCSIHGIKCMDGKEIAQLQIGQQFKNMTGMEMPVYEHKIQNVKAN